jgi:hypothetical protein
VTTASQTSHWDDRWGAPPPLGRFHHRVFGALVEKGIFRATALFRVGLINSPLVGLGLVAEYTRVLVAYVVVLGSPLTHFVIDSVHPIE